MPANPYIAVRTLVAYALVILGRVKRLKSNRYLELIRNEKKL